MNYEIGEAFKSGKLAYFIQMMARNKGMQYDGNFIRISDSTLSAAINGKGIQLFHNRDTGDTFIKYSSCENGMWRELASLRTKVRIPQDEIRYTDAFWDNSTIYDEANMPIEKNSDKLLSLVNILNSKGLTAQEFFSIDDEFSNFIRRYNEQKNTYREKESFELTPSLERESFRDMDRTERSSFRM